MIHPGGRIKVSTLADIAAGRKLPSRRARQERKAGKQGPVLQGAAAGDIFAQPPGIHPSQVGKPLQQRLGLGGKIEAVPALVIVNTAQAVPIVEQNHLACPRIHQHPREDAIDGVETLHPLGFITRKHVLEGTAIILPIKDQTTIPALVPDGKIGSE
ncbi:MAG: hypothetical protein BWY09_01355 [Candidatus Hydrogenedentes bacterium ADurb.Bin179]|nr:MAG: hypothetical protein BWY09_01355 [Candidatus Hydrogenedentes bacterium ADurb.Bin179]